MLISEGNSAEGINEVVLMLWIQGDGLVVKERRLLVTKSLNEAKRDVEKLFWNAKIENFKRFGKKTSSFLKIFEKDFEKVWKRCCLPKKNIALYSRGRESPLPTEDPEDCLSRCSSHPSKLVISSDPQFLSIEYVKI